MNIKKFFKGLCSGSSKKTAGKKNTRKREYNRTLCILLSRYRHTRSNSHKTA